MRIGLGVERWDFTKGIVERFHALEVLFEKYPEWLGRLTFLQIAAPSRSKLPAYRNLQQQTLAEMGRINSRFATAHWKPIILIGEHQEPAQVFELYRAADIMLVNSLHDGMNLVAKEFVAARDDEEGVLVLSTFAGASRELPEALLVNPYDVVETAAAIVAGMTMPREERRKRMQLMRRTVAENNVYRWAGRMLMDVSGIRQRRSLETWTGSPWQRRYCHPSLPKEGPMDTEQLSRLCQPGPGGLVQVLQDLSSWRGLIGAGLLGLRGLYARWSDLRRANTRSPVTVGRSAAR